MRNQLNGFLSRAPFQIQVEDVKVDRHDGRVKGLRISVPAVGYARDWSVDSRLWVSYPARQSNGFAFPNVTTVRASDAIQQMGVAVIVEIMTTAQEALRAAVRHGIETPAMAYVQACIEFATETIPQDLMGYYTPGIAAYANLEVKQKSGPFFRWLQEQSGQHEVEGEAPVALAAASSDDADLAEAVLVGAVGYIEQVASSQWAALLGEPGTEARGFALRVVGNIEVRVLHTTAGWLLGTLEDGEITKAEEISQMPSESLAVLALLTSVGIYLDRVESLLTVPNPGEAIANLLAADLAEAPEETFDDLSRRLQWGLSELIVDLTAILAAWHATGTTPEWFPDEARDEFGECIHRYCELFPLTSFALTVTNVHDEAQHA